MRRNLTYAIFLAIAVSCKPDVQTSQEETKSSEISTIAFGSCAYEYERQPIWDAVVSHNPDLWVWLGDIVYGDTHDMDVLRAKYNQLKSKPEYQQLLQSTEVTGIWDDHDYGINDGGKHFSKKQESQQILLDFLEVAQTDERRSREGVYTSIIYGDTRKVKLILLDPRYFRDTLQASAVEGERYMINEEGDVLGQEQWQWFEKELIENEADVHIIAIGYQLIAEEQGFEKWGNFPKARQRFFDLLSQTKPNNPLVISGDRHIAEFSKIDIPGLPQPLYDFTSSGLTHTWSQMWEESNRYREGELIVKLNFGLLQFNWDAPEPNITMQVRGVGDTLYAEVKMPLLLNP